MSDWMYWIWTWLLDKLQAVCKHDPSDVTADVLEGDAGDIAVKWCRVCGAFRRTGALEWRRPRPTWTR